MKTVWVAILLLLGAGWAGCSDASPTVPGDTDPGRTVTPYDDAIAQVSVAWQDCPEYWASGECASVTVPLFWGSSRTETISVAALRKPERAGGFSAQVWFLDGGPGSPGTTHLDWLLDLVMEFDPGLEVFTLDHRGTGASHHLSCDDQEYGDLSGACRTIVEDRYGDWLPAFSTTNAAIDLAALIEANRRDGVPVYVAGVSYGTYLAQRFLQIFPDWVDGVILDGIAPPDGTFATQNEYVDQVVQELFERCADDSTCGAKLGSDPFARVAGVLDMVEQGHCSEIGTGIDREFFVALTIEMLYARPFNELLPALFYRLERCSADDVAVWQSVISVLGYGDPVSPSAHVPSQATGEFSRVLYANVVLSELWAHPQWASADEMRTYLTETDENAVFGFNGQQLLFHSWLVWPTYDDSAYDDGWAETDTPVLMLQGELDPATFWDQARRVGDWFDGSSQYFVSFPNAAHGTLVGTPIPGGSLGCALKMALDFIDDPTSPPLEGCIDRIYPLDFSGESIPHDLLTGTDDLWGDESVAPTMLRTGGEWGSLRRPAEEMERALAQIQRRRLINPR